MERFMYQDESFEQMLKDKADEYRMYPSQQSWENIQKRIRPQSRLFNFKSIGLSAALLLSFAISISDDQTTKGTRTSFVSNLIEEQDSPVALAQVQKNTAKVIPITAAKSAKPITEQQPETIIADAIATPADIHDAQSQAADPIVLVEEENTELPKATISIEPRSLEPTLSATFAPVKQNAVDVTENESFVLPEPSFDEAIVTDKSDVPVITVPKLKKQLQFYISSSASYRVLYSDNKVTFGNLLQQDPEKVAKHTPSLGVEFGAAVLLPISKRINFRTGIQLNYTRYNVALFRSSPQ
nr:hypothetical protein [Lacibacter sp.]